MRRHPYHRRRFGVVPFGPDAIILLCAVLVLEHAVVVKTMMCHFEMEA